MERLRIISEIRFLESLLGPPGGGAHLIAKRGAQHRPATKSILQEIRKLAAKK